MLLKKIYRIYIHKFKPYKYMEKVGINFPKGGGAPLWKSYLEH